jgi:hypothetical protein
MSRALSRSTITSNWGDVPMSCTCKTCFAHCICADTVLLVSLFNPKVLVPKGLVGETVSDRKKCKSISGLAGRKKMCIIEQREDN